MKKAMAKKTIRKHPCQPGIWKKLGPAEKRWWITLYRDFLGELKIGAGRGAEITKAEKEVIAHNHACLAVWAFRDVVKRAIAATEGPVRKAGLKALAE